VENLRFFAVALTLALAAVSCKGSADVDAHYTVRGQVKNFQAEHVLIHHERIAEFKDRDGKPSAMDSMAMNFSLAPGVAQDAFKPGAKLSIEFDVRWSSGDPLVITKVTPLPDDTALVLTSDH
jgi:hypothetical protein